MTRYDIAKFYGYNSVEEYDEAEKRNNEIFFEGLKKQKPLAELKPCPFCGGKAQINYAGADLLILCSKCLVRTESYHTKAEAVEAWNRRAGND